MSPRTSRPRHLARRRFGTGGMLTVASAAAGVTLIGLAAAGTTYALYSDSVLLAPHTITSGSQELTINGTETFVPASPTWNNLLPGDRVTTEVTVTTLGDATSEIVATTTPAGGSLDVRVSKGVCPGAPLAGASSTVSPTTLGEWGPDEAGTVCIEVSLSPSAVESETVPFVLTLTATQQAS
jgi:hypothetical protein